MFGDLRGLVASRALIAYYAQNNRSPGQMSEFEVQSAHHHPAQGQHLLSGTLRNLLQDNGQVEIHHAVDEEQVCSTRSGGQTAVGETRAKLKPTRTARRNGKDRALGDQLSAASDRCKVKEWNWADIRGRLVVQLHSDGHWGGNQHRLRRNNTPQSYRLDLYCALLPPTPTRILNVPGSGPCGPEAFSP